MDAQEFWQQLQDLRQSQPARFVPYSVLQDALVQTVPFLQGCSGMSRWAHLLSKEQHGQVLLYGGGDEDEEGLPQRAVLAVHLEQLGGMMAAKRCQLHTAPQLNAFESELRSLHIIEGSKPWGFSFDRLGRQGFVITQLCDGGDLAGYLDKAVLKAYRGEEQARPDLLLGALADVSEQVCHFNDFSLHAWMDGKLSNVVISRAGTHSLSARFIDVGSARAHGRISADRHEGTWNNLDSESLREGIVTKQSDVVAFGVMLMDYLFGRPANHGDLVAGYMGYKSIPVIFGMLRDSIGQGCDAVLALNLPVANLLSFEPMLATVGLMLVPLLICPIKNVKLTAREGYCAVAALRRAACLWYQREDGPNGIPWLAQYYASLAQVCAFIGQRRKGLPESPAVTRGGAAVLGEAGLQTVKDMAVHLYGKADDAFRTFAPHLTVGARGVVADAWDLLCSEGITTDDNKLPSLCHPELAPEDFDEQFGYKQTDRRHWLTEQKIEAAAEMLHEYLTSPAGFGKPGLGHIGQNFTKEPMQEWLDCLLGVTVEYVQQAVGDQLPERPRAFLPGRLAASLIIASEQQGEDAIRPSELERLVLEARNVDFDVGDAEAGGQSTSEATVSSGGSSGGEAGMLEEQAEEEASAEGEEAEEEVEEGAANGGGMREDGAEAAAAAATAAAGEAVEGGAHSEDEVVSPMRRAPQRGTGAALAGSSGHNQGQAPKTFAAQLAELQAECVREGIAEGSPEYNDFVMDLLANSRQLLSLGPTAPQRSSRRAGAGGSTAAPTSAAVSWQAWTKSPETCCTALGLPKLPHGTAAAVLPSSICLYFAGGRHGVVQAAQTLKAMPSRLTELLGSKVYIVADVYRAAVGMQKELADSAGSAAMLAQLPSLPPDETRAHGLQFVLTLEGISLSSVGSSGSVASGSVARSNRTVGAKQPAGRAGRGHTASRQETESSFAELWKGAATELIAASGVARGPVTLTCEWGPLLSLLREHGIATCPQLSAAWQVMALRSLASVERVQRHLKLYVCVQDPSIAGTQFVPLPTRFQPRDYTTSKLAQL